VGKDHAVNAFGGADVQLQAFLNLALGGLWSDSHIGCFTHGRKRPRFNHRVGGSIASLDILEIYLTRLKSHSTSSVFQHVAS